jgi:hypothetical protein
LSRDEAVAKFELENIGGRPVKILSTKTSCGCMEPHVETPIVEPGKLAVIEVRALPVEIGEKTATVIVYTDSPLTPDIVLNVRRVGWRQPPYLLEAPAELTWPGGFSMSDKRTITVTTVESADMPRRPPLLECSLPFLKLDVKDFAEEPYTRPDVVQRHYLHSVSFVWSPPPGVFSGDVVVIDPWDSSHKLRIVVHGERFAHLRAIPSRLLLHRIVQEADAPFREFTVYCGEQSNDLEVAQDGDLGSPLIVRPIEWLEVGRRGVVRVGVKAGETRQGTFSVVLRRSSSSERLVVPVLLQ